jgi:hypothetical protein
MSRVAALLNLVKFSFLFHLKREKKKQKDCSRKMKSSCEEERRQIFWAEMNFN